MKANKDVLRQFGERVRAIRKKLGLSQEELAEKANLHYTYIGGVERGERNLSLDSIEKIANALDVEISELFVGYRGGGDGEASGIIAEINAYLDDKDIKTLQLIRYIAKDISIWAKKR